jgi:hypothetical protein
MGGKMTAGTYERLSWFVESLQNALGIKIELETQSEDEKEYKVILQVRITLAGKVWPQALHNRQIRLAVLDAVSYQLEKKMDAEKEAFREKLKSVNFNISNLKKRD